MDNPLVQDVDEQAWDRLSAHSELGGVAFEDCGSGIGPGATEGGWHCVTE